MNLKTIVNITTLAIVGFITISSSMYILNSQEEAVITRFNAYVGTVNKEGINFKIPFIDKVQEIDINTIHRIEIGFKTVKEGNSTEQAAYETNKDEGLMITSDENLVMAEAVVQYTIVNPKKWMFNVDDPEGTLKLVADSLATRNIGNFTADDILINNKGKIQDAICKDLQEKVDKYDMGVKINNVQLQETSVPDAVISAFKEVSNAKELKEKRMNEAKSYQNEKIPAARAESERLKRDAEAYKQERINDAKGDVANFEKIYQNYVNNKDITRTRLYLETMEKVLPGVQKYFIDGNGKTIQILNGNNNQTQQVANTTAQDTATQQKK